jgi:2-C-methyl-D-erythritol 2,4-cyclodiphosphate synthase
VIRVGHGFDVHRFSDDADRVLRLAGVEVPGHRGLAGHSDADVIAHAVADALLGAVGRGDIGELFPDSDPAWAGADSMTLLASVAALVAGDAWRVGNVDVTVVAESPRIAPHRSAMQDKLSALLDAPVSVKGKRAEGLGALGRQEGIACWAVALVERP